MKTNIGLPKVSVSPRMLAATQSTIRKMAWHTAQGNDQRANDAKRHCEQLGVDWTKPLTP